MRATYGTNPSKKRTRTNKTSQADCPVAQDPAGIINEMLSKLLPWHYFKLLAVTPWSVRFEIKGVEFFASTETNWKICLTDSQENPSESLLCEHLNYLLTRDTQQGESAGPENSRSDTLVFNQTLSDEAYLRVEVIEGEKIIVNFEPSGTKYVRMLNAGEGYRWLKPGEKKRPGDQFFDVDMWVETDEPGRIVEECERDTFRRAKNARRRYPKSEGYAGSLEA